MKTPNVKGINSELQALIDMARKKEKKLAWERMGSGTAKFLVDTFSEMPDGEISSCLNYLVREAKLKRNDKN